MHDDQIRDFDEAMAGKVLKTQLAHFLYEHGMEDVVQNIFQVTCALEAAKLQKTMVQTDLTQYFSVVDDH